jgi:hypothetical protein
MSTTCIECGEEGHAFCDKNKPDYHGKVLALIADIEHTEINKWRMLRTEPAFDNPILLLARLLKLAVNRHKEENGYCVGCPPEYFNTRTETFGRTPYPCDFITEQHGILTAVKSNLRITITDKH